MRNVLPGKTSTSKCLRKYFPRESNCLLRYVLKVFFEVVDFNGLRAHWGGQERQAEKPAPVPQGSDGVANVDRFPGLSHLYFPQVKQAIVQDSLRSRNQCIQEPDIY